MLHFTSAFSHVLLSHCSLFRHLLWPGLRFLVPELCLHIILILLSEVETNPALWLTAVSPYKARCGVRELCTRVGWGDLQLKSRGLARGPGTVVVVVEGSQG